MATIEMPYQKGMKVGLGIDRLNGDRSTSSATKSQITTRVPQAGGPKTTMRSVTVDTTESLSKSLGVSVEVGGHYAGFSGNAKVDYLNSCNCSSFCHYFMIRVSVQNAFESLDNPEFSDDAAELIRNNNATRFRQRFGDGFISGIQTGGEFFAIFQIVGSSKTTRESISAKLHLQYDALLAGGSIDASMDYKTEQSSSRTEIQVHLYREGTIKPVSTDMKEIMKAAETFPIDVQGDGAYPYSVLVQSYDKLKSPNDAYHFYEFQAQQDALADMGKQRFSLMKFRDDLAFIIRHPSVFQNADGSAVDVEKLVDVCNQAKDAIADLDRRATACARDATKCELATMPKFIATPLPKLIPGHDKPREQYEVPNLVSLRFRAVCATAMYGPGLTTDAINALLDSDSQVHSEAQGYIVGLDKNFWKFVWKGDTRQVDYWTDDTIVSQTPTAGSIADEGTVIEVSVANPTEPRY